jgi:hypothetical protein
MNDIITGRHLLLSLFTVALAAGCTDDTAQDDFVGSWAYSTGMFALDCGGQQMQFPLDGTLIETFAIGRDRDLSKTDSMGCTSITFDLDGDVARLAPSPQSCTITGMGTSTADVYTMTLSGDRQTLNASSSGTFLAPGAPGPCTFVGGGTLVKQ